MYEVVFWKDGKISVLKDGVPYNKFITKTEEICQRVTVYEREA